MAQIVADKVALLGYEISMCLNRARYPEPGSAEPMEPFAEAALPRLQAPSDTTDPALRRADLEPWLRALVARAEAIAQAIQWHADWFGLNCEVSKDEAHPGCAFMLRQFGDALPKMRGATATLRHSVAPAATATPTALAVALAQADDELSSAASQRNRLRMCISGSADPAAYHPDDVVTRTDDSELGDVGHLDDWWRVRPAATDVLTHSVVWPLLTQPRW